MLVTFSGMDCSGKSTQLRAVDEAASRRGLRVRTLWHRAGYSPEMERLKRLLRRVRPQALPTIEDPARHRAAFERRGVRRAWLAAAWLDTFYAYAVKVRAWNRTADLVLCDRYLWDARIDLELRFGGLSPLQATPWQLLETLVPQPDRRFLFALPMAEIERRFEIKGELFRDTDALRAERFERYRALARDPSFTVIRADRPLPEVTAEVLHACGL
jgi:thymidylate kinase